MMRDGGIPISGTVDSLIFEYVPRASPLVTQCPLADLTYLVLASVELRYPLESGLTDIAKRGRGEGPRCKLETGNVKEKPRWVVTSRESG